MPDRSYHVYVIQGRGQRDYAECQAALAAVPARLTTLLRGVLLLAGSGPGAAAVR